MSIVIRSFKFSSSRSENGICVQKHVRSILSPPPSDRAILPACVPSITKHPVCIESTMNALTASCRFHNRPAAIKTLVSFPVVPSLRTLSLSLFLFLVFLSPQSSLVEQARPTFDRTKDYRPDSLSCSANLPFPSKIDSRESPLRPLIPSSIPLSLYASSELPYVRDPTISFR